ncbi:uncharacterized protein LOC144179766 [Haemaphysalis longicornis]
MTQGKTCHQKPNQISCQASPTRLSRPPTLVLKSPPSSRRRNPQPSSSQHRPTPDLPTSVPITLRSRRGTLAAIVTLLPVVGGVVVVVGLLLAIVMVLLLLGAAQDDASLVSTTSGKFVGTMVPVNGGKVYRWLGIPYAKSTGGKNRFHKPIPRTVQKRATADKPRPPCPQWVNGTLVGSEDCLHMNVWAPNGSWATRSNRTLVLASSGYWFQRGSNNEPDWAELAFQATRVITAKSPRSRTPRHPGALVRAGHRSRHVQSQADQPQLDLRVVAVQSCLPVVMTLNEKASQAAIRLRYIGFLWNQCGVLPHVLV